MLALPNLMSASKFVEQLSKEHYIGKNKAYALVKEPGFPSVKIGNRLYVLTDKIDEWFNEKSKEKNK